jgi:hypothetical protein
VSSLEGDYPFSPLGVLLIAGLCSPEPSYIFRVKESELGSPRRGAMLCTVPPTIPGLCVAHKETYDNKQEGAVLCVGRGSPIRPSYNSYTPLCPYLRQWPLRILLRADRSKYADSSKPGIVRLA